MNVENAVRIVKVFVSSPIDVAPERGRVQAVAAKLNRDFDGLVRFDTVLWEEHFYKADRSFQPQIPEAVACDVLVSIFWTRVGTELPADFARMPNGEPYPSGTAYELLTALAASKTKGVPDVYVFRKTADAVLPTADLERRRQAQTQLDALEAFWGEWFKSEQGHFKAAFQTFANTDEFEGQIEQLLRQWLESHSLLGPRLRWPKEKGSPFRGLAPFEAEHAAVFFGRERMIDEARRRLVAAAEHGSPFLVIVGASGAGKSSLARAGLIPRLTTPGVVASVDLWRVAIMKPSEGQAGPVASLAAALFATLPELAQGDFPTAAALIDNLRRGGAAAARPVVGALTRIAETEQHERRAELPLRPVLVLLVDQLEELFAQAIADDERAAFAEVLKELVATGQVWCIGTLRADLYELLLRQSVLKAMKEAGASLDLTPPGAAELAEIVRAPAAAAGLVFESNAEQGAVDERILADAKTPDSLPLLQFTLRQLYERRTEAGEKTLLTHAAYDALGGLQGAVAAEAERAVAVLPAVSLDALPQLLRQLAEPARDGKSLTLREVAQADAAAAPAPAALVDTLLGARILIAGQDAAGRPTLRLAHDAVLTSWPRAHAAAQASREFYRIRAEVEEALARWQEHGRERDRLIQPGVPLAEAEKLVADFGGELPKEFVAFVRLSRDRARVRQRLIAAAAVFFLCLAVAATGASIWAYRAQRQALAERDRALLNDSQRLLDLIAAAKPDDPTTTALLSLEGLPGLSEEEQRPYLAPLEASLYPAVDRLREMLVIDKPIMSPDERRVAALNRDFTVSVYDIETGNQLLLKGHQANINAVAFSEGGKLIATASADKTARLWNAETGELMAVLSLHTAPVTFVDFNDNDHSVMTVSDDGSIRRWNAADGRPLAAFASHEGGVQHYWSNFQKHLLVSVSKTQVVRMWNIDTGQLLSRPDSDDQAALAARNIEATQINLNDDGTRLLITRDGPSNSVILWDVQAGHSMASFDQTYPNSNSFVDNHRLLEILRPGLFDVRTGNRFVDANTGRVIFNEGGFPVAKFKGDRFIITNDSFSVPIYLWDATTFKQIAKLTEPPESMAFAEFISDGKQIVTAPKDGTVKIWSSETGDLIRSISIAYDDIFLTPDGVHVVATLQQGGAQVWDLQTGEKILDLDTRKETSDDNSPQLPAVNLIISADGKRAAARLGKLQIVRLWDLAAGSDAASANIRLDAESKEDIQTFKLNGDGTKLLILGKTAAEIWALPNLSMAATINYAGAMEFSKGGDALIAKDSKENEFGKAQPTRIWRIAADMGIFNGRSLAGHVQYGVLAPQRPQSLAVLGTPDDARRLGLSAAVSVEGRTAIEIIDLSSGRILRTLAGASDYLRPVTASADGRRLLTQSLIDPAQVWDTGTGEHLMDVEPDRVDALNSRNAYAFSDNGQRLCLVTFEGTQLHVTIWDVDGRAKLASTVTKLDGLRENALVSLDAKFSADGLRITVDLYALFDSWGRMLALDAQTAAMKRDLGSPNDNEDIIASPRGTWFLLVSKDGNDTRARLLNSDTGLVTNLQLPGGKHGAWFSADERRFIVASSADVGIWDAATGSLLKSCSIADNSDWVSNAVFSPDGASIAFGTSSGAAYICDTATGKASKLLAGSSGASNPVKALSFSGDGHWLSVSSTGIKIIKNLDGDPAVVASMPDDAERMTFSSNAGYLVTGKSDEGGWGSTVHRLFPTTASLVEYARSKLPRCLTPIERKQYHLVAEPPLWCVEMAKWPYNTAEWGKWFEARKSGPPAPIPADPRFAVDQ
jgi:WD40 repeat protein